MDREQQQRPASQQRPLPPRPATAPESATKPGSGPGGDTTSPGQGPGGGPAAAPVRQPTSLMAMAAVAAGLVLGAFLPSVFGDGSGDPGQRNRAEALAATLAFQPAPKIAMPKQAEPWPSCVASSGSSALGDLDLVLAVDTTASMGNVIADVKKNLQGLIANLAARGSSTRIGIVAYRDVGDSYVTQPFPLTALDDAGTKALTAFVAGLSAAGGGDWPEAVDEALRVATSMPWRPGASASIVVVGDAPARLESRARAEQIVHNFASRAGGQVSVVDSGSGAHHFLRRLPEVGAGQYVTYDGNILNSLFPAITGCAAR